MNRLNLNKLYYFYIVAMEGSIKAASERLNLTQPTISAQIRQLEQELDIELFKRSHRKIEVNSKGRALLKKAEKLFSLADEIENTLPSLGKQERLSVKIGAIQSLSNSFIYDFSLKLWKNNLIKISVSQGQTTHLYERLNAGEFDLLLTDTPPPKSKRYSVTNLGSDKLLAVASQNFKKNNPFPSCLHERPYVAFSGAGLLQENINFFFKTYGIVPDILGEVDDVTLMRVIAQNSNAFCILPLRAARESIRLGELAKIGELKEFSTNLYGIMPSYSPKQKIVRQVIKDYFVRKS